MNNKQAACLNCRKSKIKCRREPDSSVCQRCEHVGVKCVIPEFHIGRQKGVKNKRSGLEKAIYQVEEAIKKRRRDDASSQSMLEHLQKLLTETQGQEGDSPPKTSDLTTPFSDNHNAVEGDASGPTNDEHLALEGVENPLQLLARASDLRMASPQSFDNSASTPGRNGSVQSEYLDVHEFFLPMKAKLDQGPGTDPIDIGLVTLEEAEMLLNYFHSNLAHTRWGLDPVIHTMQFVRSRSSFLFTTILAVTTVFVPGAASLSRRLLLHRKFLTDQILLQRCRSVEIVLAFMINIPWLPAGSHSNEDDTCTYLTAALSRAMDLSLHKIITPSSSFDQDAMRRIPQADCIDAKKALTMDGFEDVEVDSEWGQRLLRRRERAWISLFVLERGVCLARGRSYCVPKTPLIMRCDEWHHHRYSDVQDGPLISMAVLRRDLDDLFSTVRLRCDSCHATDVGSKVAQDIDKAIDSFFAAWFQTWTSVIGDHEHKTLPPYVETLVIHTRLSTYCMLLNHPSAPPEVKRSFRASALSSALNVMRVTIQGESRLKSMPNNTVTMICFAASIALALSTPMAGKNRHQNLAPSVRNLIQETATVLERIGSTPPHRNGASVIYGRFLRVLIKQAPNLTHPHQQDGASLPSEPAPPRYPPPSPSHHVNPYLASTAARSDTKFDLPSASPAMTWSSEPLLFSAMSYNEVNETVTNSDFFATALLDLPWDDDTPLLWADGMNLPDFNFP